MNKFEPETYKPIRQQYPLKETEKGLIVFDQRVIKLENHYLGDLTITESSALMFLMDAASEEVRYDLFYQALYPQSIPTSENNTRDVLRSVIRRMRTNLDNAHPKLSRHVVNRRDLGYQFVPHESVEHYYRIIK